MADHTSAAEPDDDLNPVQQTVMLAIERGVPLFNDGQPAACAAIYEVAATALLSSKPDALTRDAQVVLSTALRNAGQQDEPAERAWTLRRALDRALAMCGGRPFSPIIEAPLPEGFPPPGPIGEVVVKQYPAHRLALAEGRGRRFMRLFNHIKQNDIAMTTPVQMRLSEPKAESEAEAEQGGGDDPRIEEMNMAFFYQDPELGEAGETKGGVTVKDVPAVTVLSVGIRGGINQDVLDNARQQLLDRLSAPDSGFERAGPLRLMGYNSPMVPAVNRFHELQLPVRPVE